MNESVVAVVFGSCCLLLVVGGVAIVVSAVRRQRRGSQHAQQQGWERVPDGTDVVAGWQDWPFTEAIREGGRTNDVLTGVHAGVRFMSLRWSQLESGRGEGGGDSETYNVVAVATRHRYPRLSVVRGRHYHGVPEGRFETGDPRFDRRFDTFGDAAFGADLLTEPVRAAIDEHGHALVFQPGWITRVTPWTFYSGEERMIDELEALLAPLRLVPPQVWSTHGGPPDFLTSFRHSG